MDEHYDRVVKELEALKAERDSLAKRVHTLNHDLKAHQKELHLMKNSQSWRVTKPLRLTVFGLKAAVVFVLCMGWGLVRRVGEHVPAVAHMQRAAVRRVPRLKALLERRARESKNEGVVVATQFHVPQRLTPLEAQVLKVLRSGRA